MSNAEEKIYVYSELFSQNYDSKTYNDKCLDDFDFKKEIEYSLIRSKNSKIINNYFDNEKIKPEKQKKEDGIISFPVNKNYSLNLFEGELLEQKHKIKLTKPGFYSIYLENNNNSKWDSVYLGFSKIQVALDYKLIIKKKLDSEIEKRDGNDKNEEKNENTNEMFDGDKSRDLYKNNNYDKLNDEVQAACRFNIEESEKCLKKSLNLKKIKNKENENKDEDEEENEFENEDENEDECEYFEKTNKLCVKDTNYYDNLVLKNKFSSILYNISNNPESYSCSYKKKDQIRVSSKKKKNVYLYNKNANTILEIHATTYMSLGMTVTCKYGILYCGKYNQLPKDPYIPFKKSVFILSLDGGGVLSISSLQILHRLETEIRKEIGNDDINLIDCFDMISGTSAGGLITLALLREIKIQDMIKFWPNTIKKIFEGNRNIISGILFEGYDINKVKNVLIEHIGNKFISSYKKIYCFVTATDVKHKPYKLFLIRNYTHKYNSINGESYDGINKVPLWFAAWATSSAPTYLKGPNSNDINKLGMKIKPEIHLVDGALKANNPSLIALEECARLNNKSLSTFIKEDLDGLVSIGTGQIPTKLTNNSSYKNNSASTFDILINSTHLLTRANDTHREVLQWLADKENCYFRFNTPNIGEIKLDSQDIKDFDLIIKATQDYLFDEKYYEIKRLAHKLANNYIRSKYI